MVTRMRSWQPFSPRSRTAMLIHRAGRPRMVLTSDVWAMTCRGWRSASERDQVVACKTRRQSTAVLDARERYAEAQVLWEEA